MTAPRQVLPGATYLITRRCTQRQFWLRPSDLTNQIIAYCVATGATRTGIQIHGICALSNHWHAVVSDPHARLPQFLAWTHKYIAKCINASYGRWENLWASEKPSAVRLEDDGDVVDKLVYCLTNPVSAGLVARGSQWPGVRTNARDVGEADYQVPRPPIFFREDGSMPQSVTLRIERPAICPELSNRQLAEHVHQLVERAEANIRHEFAKSGRRFLGADVVLRQLPTDSPRTMEPRRKLSPCVAAKNKWARIEALRRLCSFGEAYRKALDLWRAGWREALFPAGTYAMRIRHRVLCRSP